MADIVLKFDIAGISKDDLKRALLEAMQKLDGKYPFKVQQREGNIMAKGKGFEGSIEIKDTVLKLNCNLGLFLKPLKGKIESEMKKIVEREISSLREAGS